MADKAWLYWCKDDDLEFQCLWADTPGQAKKAASWELGCDFVDVRIKRIPQWDNLGHDPNKRDWLEAGYTVECHRCTRTVYPDEAEYDAEDEPLCEECAEIWLRPAPEEAAVL